MRVGPGAPIVVDASVAVQWVAPEPTSELAARLRDRSLTAPDLLAAECANALWKTIGRDEFKVDRGRRKRFLQCLRGGYWASGRSGW